MIEKLYSTDVIEMVNKLNEVIDFLNDTNTMKVKDGQYITSTDDFVTGLTCTTITDSMLPVTEPTSISGDQKCPYCGASYYTEMYSISTAVYYPPIYKDGVNINPDRNKTTRHCKCIWCGKEFDI